MTINPFAPLRVVRINKVCPDPALDLQEMDVEAYKLNRADESLIKVQEGSTPDWFIIKRLPTSYLTALKDAAFTPHKQASFGFVTACVRIEKADGTVMEPKKTTKLKLGTKTVVVADEDWIDEVAAEFGYDTVVEMGQIAIDFSGLPKGSTGPFSCWVGTVART